MICDQAIVLITQRSWHTALAIEPSPRLIPLIMDLGEDLVSKWLSPGKNVLVIGDLMLDIYIRGATHRLASDSSAPVLEVSDTVECLGGAANLAHNLIRLSGCSVRLIGVVGNDRSGAAMVKLATDAKISIGGILLDSGRPTTQKNRVVDQNDRLIVQFDQESRQEISSCIESRAISMIAEEIRTADCVFCSDYNKGFLTTAILNTIFAEARQLSLPVLVDPKGTQVFRYSGATLLTPNVEGLANLTGRRCTDDLSICEAARSLIDVTKASGIIVTCGPDGAHVVESSEYQKCGQAYQCSEGLPIDPNGAGDTFLAAFGLAFACHHASLINAALFANMTAAIAVRHRGTYAVSRDEVMTQIGIFKNGLGSPAIYSPDPAKHKIVSWPQLHVHLQKRTGKIVFTNGCFDLLHAGHISLLERAKGLGSTLIVALNSDESVTRLKGSGRPVLPQWVRAAALAAFACVDFVIFFPDNMVERRIDCSNIDTPIELIRLVKPDVLVKGGDYKLSEVVGREVVRSTAGSTVVLPLEGKVSTTWIVDRLRNKSLSSTRHK